MRPRQLIGLIPLCAAIGAWIEGGVLDGSSPISGPVVAVTGTILGALIGIALWTTLAMRYRRRHLSL